MTTPAAQSRFVLMPRADPPGVTLMFVSGNGASLPMAHSVPADSLGLELERVARIAARFLGIPCERVTL